LQLAAPTPTSLLDSCQNSETPTLSKPALDSKGGTTTPVKEDAGQEMNALVCSNLRMNDGKAMAILCTHASPIGLNSQYQKRANGGGGREAEPLQNGILGSREEGQDCVLLLPSQSSARIDSEEKVLMFPMIELEAVAGAE
ncbi:hypothetical protein A6R68_02047, partial [Neotoma lepida]